MPAPSMMMRAHVAAVAHAEQQRGLRAIGIFMQLSGGMDDECAGENFDRLGGRAHRAAAGKAKIDFHRLGMTVIGTDLPGLPAGDGHVAVADPAQYFLDVLPRIPFPLAPKADYQHREASLRLYEASAVPTRRSRHSPHPPAWSAGG